MFYTNNINKALKIAFNAHKNQVDKNGVPYIFHPFYVACQQEDEISIIVALLHDVVEDTDITLEDLEKDFPIEVIDALKLLTHNKEDNYLEYILKIKDNPIARKVKLADLTHNSNLTRLEEFGKEDLERIAKYELAKRILLE